MDDIIALYSDKILSFANKCEDINLSHYNAYSKKRAPICGSTVEVFLNIENDIIVDYGHRIRACALGKASAYLIFQNLKGTSINEIPYIQSRLHDMFKFDGPIPLEINNYHYLEPAKPFKNRHASILLSIDAISSAINSFKTDN